MHCLLSEWFPLPQQLLAPPSARSWAPWTPGRAVIWFRYSKFFLLLLLSLAARSSFFSLSFFFLLNNYSFCLHKIHSNVSLRDRRGFFCIARVEQLEDGTGQCYVQPAATRHWFVCFRGAYGPRKLLTFLREGGTGICHHAFVWHFNFLLFTTIPRLYCFNLIGYWLSIYFDLLYLFGKN